MKIPGDFVECGVNRGAVSSTVMIYIDWNATRGARKYSLMDTFQGLVPELINDAERAIGRPEMFDGCYTECYEKTKKNFEEFDDGHTDASRRKTRLTRSDARSDSWSRRRPPA
ncbi:MAG: TylF/MycF/NovP-related O-methyltransferase, partial [Methylocystis sp.]